MVYPYDIVTFKRQKTLSIESHLVAALDESPMKIVDETFSRFVINIINKEAPAGHKACFFNLHPEELPKIQAITQKAFNSQMEKSYCTAPSPALNRPAFTVRFKFGNLKGKTAAEILANDYEKGKVVLKEQYKFLKEGLAKYPNNQVEMDAISDSATLTAEDLELVRSGTCSDSGDVYQIFSLAARPLTRKTNEAGLSFCYEGSILWDTSRNYPVSVSIKNYYAPVVKKENGMLNVQVSQKDVSSEVSEVFNLTDSEWLFAVNEMDQTLKNFKSALFSKAYNLAEEAGRINRQQ